jgi:predicted MFS family arabinose efflux permease
VTHDLLGSTGSGAGSRVSTLTAEADQPRLARWALLIGAGVFATTFAQPAVLKLPLQYLLKSELHVSRDAMAAFFAAGALAWYFKPLTGILSDSVPLFGTRRRHYLLLSALMAGGLWLLVGLVPRTYPALLIAVIALNAMLVVGSTVVGGVMVEIGQRYRATGRLSSARYFVQNVCVLLGGPVGGFLATRSFGLTAVVGGAVALSVVPVAWWLLREAPVARTTTAAWTSAKAQLRTLMRSATLWSAAGLLFLVYIAPGFQTPLYYFQTDTLGFSQEFIGTLGFLSGAFGLVGAFLYGVLCPRLPLRWLLALGISLSALGTLCYLFYRSATAAALIEGENGFLITLAELALMDLAARATPRGSEGLGFALMMSVRNGALAVSDIAGSWLIEQHHVSFFSLVWLNAGTTALILVVVPFLPRQLIDRRDAGAGV